MQIRWMKSDSVTMKSFFSWHSPSPNRMNSICERSESSSISTQSIMHHTHTHQTASTKESMRAWKQNCERKKARDTDGKALTRVELKINYQCDVCFCVGRMVAFVVSRASHCDCVRLSAVCVCEAVNYLLLLSKSSSHYDFSSFLFKHTKFTSSSQSLSSQSVTKLFSLGNAFPFPPPFRMKGAERERGKKWCAKINTRGTVNMHAQWQWRICIHIVAAGKSNTVNFTLLLSSMCHLDQQSVGIVGFGLVSCISSAVDVVRRHHRHQCVIKYGPQLLLLLLLCAKPRTRRNKTEQERLNRFLPLWAHQSFAARQKQHRIWTETSEERRSRLFTLIVYDCISIFRVHVGGRQSCTANGFFDSWIHVFSLRQHTLFIASITTHV